MLGLRARDLTMRFEKFTAVNDVSFDIAPGEFVTLLGPSGCGKTTLLKMLSGFYVPTSGTIEMGDEDVTRVPPEARDTAMCFQSYALFPHLTVHENLDFGLKQKGLPSAERKTRIDEISDILNLGPQLEKLPNQLSGGQQQRVSLGRALVMRPGVILFDEPLSNLDAKLRDKVRVEIRRIQRDFGLTAIYVTHDQSEALALSDRVFVMNAGRIEQADSPETLYARPKTPFVADFIGSANVVTCQIRGELAPGLISVETPVGQLTAKLRDAADKTHTHLCWRPEAVKLGDKGLPAKVLDRAFQGAFTDLIVETNGVSHKVQTPQTHLQVGDTTHIEIAPEHVILLGAAT